MGEAADGLSAIAAVKTHQPDLLVLDAAMPMARGIEVYSDARRWSPKTRICLLTGFTSVGLLADWIDAGVDGLMLKGDTTDMMQEGLSTLVAGGSYISPNVTAMLETDTTSSKLTPREREVLSLIATGQENRRIAERLCISPKTVEKHRASLMSKLGVHSVAELMVYALREGWLDDHRQL